MIFAWMQTGVGKLVQQADLTSKMVLLILLGMSVVCWAIFLYHLIALYIKEKNANEVYAKVKASTNLSQLPSFIMYPSYKEEGHIIESLKKRGELTRNTINREDLMTCAHEIIEEYNFNYEASISIIAISANVSPLLGLLGTIWGLIHSFLSISQYQSADIITIAPGIAEALITTLAGLIVAIPAVFMIGYLQVRAARLMHKYEHISRALIDLIELTFKK